MARAALLRTPRTASHGGDAHFWALAVAPLAEHARRRVPGAASAYHKSACISRLTAARQSASLICASVSLRRRLTLRNASRSALA